MDTGNPTPSTASEFYRLLHRGHDAKILLSHSGNEWDDLGAIRVSEIDNQAEQLAPMLKSGDLYGTVNSFDLAHKTRRKKPFKFLPAVRGKNHLKWLNAVWSDVDYYAVGLTRTEARQAITDAIVAGEIPQPSAIVHSGRGLYLFWFLHDPDAPNLPPLATPTRREQQEAINRAIVERFTHIGADRKSIDSQRVLRWIGAANSKATGEDAEVTHHLFHEEEGKVPSYSFEELEAHFLPRQTASETPKLAPGKRGKAWCKKTAPPRRKLPQNAAGRDALGAYRAEAIELIEADLKGWKKGTRRNRMRFYGYCLRAAGLPFEDILAKVSAMAARCVPPYPSDRRDETPYKIVNHVFNFTEKPLKLEDKTLIEVYDVTPEMARRLELPGIIPIVRQEREANEKSNRVQVKAQIKAKRIEAILTHHAAHPYDSDREIFAALKAHGVEASLATVQRDISRLLPERQKSKGGRPLVTEKVQKDVSMSLLSVCNESVNLTPTKTDILNAASRFKMLFGDATEAEADLRDFARLCSEEAREPGSHESAWFWRMEAKVSKFEEEAHDDFMQKTYGVAPELHPRPDFLPVPMLTTAPTYHANSHSLHPQCPRTPRRVPHSGCPQSPR